MSVNVQIVLAGQFCSAVFFLEHTEHYVIEHNPTFVNLGFYEGFSLVLVSLFFWGSGGLGVGFWGVWWVDFFFFCEKEWLDFCNLFSVFPFHFQV